MSEKLKDMDKEYKETPDFNFFITTLALQAAIFLGQLENPSTNKKEENLPQAKLIIDTLSMLKEKTKGNLNEEETQAIDNLLYELRTQYIVKTEDKPCAIDKTE